MCPEKTNFDKYNIICAQQLKDDEAFSTTNIIPVRSAIEKAIKSGCDYVYTTSWASYLCQADIDRNVGIQSILNKHSASLAIIEIPAINVVRMHFTRYFEKEFKFSVSATKFFCCGRQLILTLPAATLDDAKKKSPDLSIQIVNHIRMIFGIGAALEQTLDTIFCMSSGSLSIERELNVFPEAIGKGDDQRIISELAGDEIIGDLLFTPDQSLMFHRASCATANWERFLYLWMCLEFKLGNGTQRTRFFTNDIQSGAINDEAFRLFQIRCSISHEGNADISRRDCESILWALRVAIMPNLALQKTVAEKYEAWIIESQ